MKKFITVLTFTALAALAALAGSPAFAKRATRHAPMDAYAAMPQSTQGLTGSDGYGMSDDYLGQSQDPNVRLELERDHYRQ